MPRLPPPHTDVSIKDKPVGRIEAVLFSDISPRAAENMRQLCTGEAGVVPEGREGAGKPYWLKGRPFYRIIDQFIDQTGAETESVFGTRDMGGKAPGQVRRAQGCDSRPPCHDCRRISGDELSIFSFIHSLRMILEV